jgi:hypothetical protein
MLAEAMAALAATCGNAVVQAACTDAWTGFRKKLAGLLGRGDRQRVDVELEKLDQTATALAKAAPDELERIRIHQEAVWQTRIEALLESLDGAERERFAGDLRSLLQEQAASSKGATAGHGGLAVDGNVHIHADKGSIASGIIYGGASVGTPPAPDPSQG